MTKIRSTAKLISISIGQTGANKKSTGAITVVLTREHVFGSRNFFSTSQTDAITGYTSGTIFQLHNLSEKAHGQFKLLMTGQTGDQAPVRPMLTQKCPQRLQTATSSLWAIYMASSPAILELLEFLEVTFTPKNTSKPSKSIVIKSLVLSTTL